jgi:GMP synthase (glutamine-hydrolysing)
MIFGLYHAPAETVGSMESVIKRLKLPFTGVRLYAGDGLPRNVSDLEGLIVMGGPMNVDEVHKYPFLLPEVQLIEKVLAEKKPVLGICLGAQLIAKALDMKVFPNKVKEVGWHPIQLTDAGAQDPNLNDFPKEIKVLHWHGDTFDLPKGAVHLAKSEKCANQAFKWGAKTYALQFHLEATPSMCASWCAAKSEQGFIKAAGEDPKKIKKEALSAWEELGPLSNSFFTSYLKTVYGNVPVTV